MKLFATLRMLGLVRRGVRALESLARSQSLLARLAEEREHRAATRIARRRSPRPTELGVVDVVEVERRYQEQLKREALSRE